MKKLSTRVSDLLLVLLVLLAFFLLIYRIDKPFIGHHDWNGAFWGAIVRNYLRGQFSYFTHYTPLLPFLFTLSSLVFGLSEFSLRITTVFFSLVMLVFLYKIGKLLYSETVGLTAVALAIVTPMFLYFGKLPDHEPIITSFITITFYFYLKLVKGWRSYFLFLTFLTVTLLESWSGFFLIPFLIIDSFIFHKQKLLKPLNLIFLGLIVVLIHLFFIDHFSGISGLRGFWEVARLRLNTDSAGRSLTHFTFKQFLSTEAHYGVIYFTRVLSALTVVWLGKLFWQICRKKINRSDVSLTVLGLYAFSFVFVFQNLAFIHDYKLYLFLPFIALSSAQIINLLAKKASLPVIRFLIIFFFIAAVATERISYLKTLLNSSFNTPGYLLGKMIKTNVSPGENVLIASQEFGSFYEVFVYFYADRNIAFKDLTLERFKREKYQDEYDFLVLIDNRPEDKNLEDFLTANYQFNQSADFRLFDLHDFKEQPPVIEPGVVKQY